MSKNYYEALGVPRTATKEEIHRAFKKVALENHPDRNPGNAEAEARFKLANQAHQVLTDDAKRRAYDMWGDENGPPPRPRPGPWRKPVDFDSIFVNFDFGHGPFQDFRRSKPPPPAPSPGGDVNVSVTVTMEEALAGAKKEVRFDKGESRPCTQCARTRHATVVCPVCSGSGRVISMARGTTSHRTCLRCKGAGNVPVVQCELCKGSGVETVRRSINLTIPAGIQSGQELRVRGHGRPGSPPGDLIVSVDVQDSPSWWARGNELFTVAEVDAVDFLRGGQTELRMPDGRAVSVTVPPGGGHTTVPGAWRVPGRDAGSLTVIFKAKLGKGVTPRAERLLRELLEESGGGQR